MEKVVSSLVDRDGLGDFLEEALRVEVHTLFVVGDIAGEIVIGAYEREALDETVVEAGPA